MSKYWRLMKQKMLNYNVENRAFKELDRIDSTGVAAPRYAKLGENADIDPQITKAVTTKLPELEDHLKSVKVTSVDPSPEEQWKMVTSREMESRMYPLQGRRSIFGFFDPEPDKVPKGKISFREALELMSFHQQITSMTSQVNNPNTSNKMKETLLSNLEPLHIQNEHHPARERVPKEKVSLLLDYFAPFIYEIDTKATWGWRKREKQFLNPEPETKDDDDEQDFNLTELTYLRKMKENLISKEETVALEREELRKEYLKDEEQKKLESSEKQILETNQPKKLKV